MFLLLARVALATTLDQEEAVCIALDLAKQAPCWMALEAAHPWSPHRLDWQLRQLDLARLVADRQGERRALRALSELRAGGWWIPNVERAKASDVQKATEALATLVSDEPAWDPASLGVTLPAGVSGAASWLATDDPKVWKAAREQFHGLYNPELAGPALLWEAWCAWQMGEHDAALTIHGRVVDVIEDSPEPSRVRREYEDQEVLFRTSVDWLPDITKWAKGQPIEIEAAAAVRLREQGNFGDAVGLWRDLVSRAPMDARAPLWHVALVRDLLDPAARQAEIPKLLANYGANSTWYQQQDGETRERVATLLGKLMPYRPEVFGDLAPTRN